ncbi:MAG: Uma2 family endonuclease [Deltaproteobacteria bacterium]|nr:Uma2 family endonuclease [Deltaproteobacteria bacterium]
MRVARTGGRRRRTGSTSRRPEGVRREDRATSRVAAGFKPFGALGSEGHVQRPSNARPSTPGWRLDPTDPRAPSREVWAALSPEARAAVVDALPSELEPELGVAPPEGDDHFEASVRPRGALRRFFDKLGRRIYIGTNLPVFYPAERVFAPDMIAVLEVDPGPRRRWVVEAEGKGVDLALEVHVAGGWRKDLVDDVERYARLGIREYFAFNVTSGALVGYRLEAEQRYTALVAGPDGFRSEVLGLDLLAAGGRVRFFHAGARVPELDELVVRLEAAMTEALAHVRDLERRLEEERAAREAAEAELAGLRDELAKLKG